MSLAIGRFGTGFNHQVIRDSVFPQPGHYQLLLFVGRDQVAARPFEVAMLTPDVEGAS
jgi:hypothetical protein